MNEQVVAERRRRSPRSRQGLADSFFHGHQFVAGDRFTIADITALVAIDRGPFGGNLGAHLAVS